MTKEKVIPQIRFSGFTDTWEQRELGDIGKARSGVGFPDAEQGGVTGIPFFKVSDMNLGGNENEMTVANNYVTAEQIAVHRWSPITELPAIFFAKVGAAVMLNRKRLCRFPFLLDNNTMAYSLSSTKWDADFAKALFGTVDLTSLVQVGALPSYNARDVESMEIYLPSLLEQEQIGGFFKQLDNLITLHQRKYDKLTKVKKAMLEKMFPENGSPYPEIRFKGFTDAWEQRKFSELTEIRSASRVHKEEWQSSGVPFYRSSDVMAALNGTENEKAFISEELYEKLSAVSGKLEKGDILVTGGGSVGKPYIVPNNEPLYTKDADLLWVKNNEKLVPYFIYTFFFSPAFSDYLNSVSHVGTIAHYTITQLEETPITLPCVSEQQKIGDYFRNIDSLITLHQRKLEKLKNIKKACLEKMFV